ncbi:hypothetical protein GCM10011586_13290 [Silvibacterium dinghuense]|nr:hypothetical protein GCM10011586_13290 [Silvibacterium dinghuense]
MLLMMFALHCHAQTACPWVNQATVTDSPDGAVREAHTSVAADGNRCTFDYRDGEAAYSVEIAVQGVPDHGSNSTQPEVQCASPKTPLIGIGNEAAVCSIGAHRMHGAQVMGRVRDKSFFVIVRSHGDPDTPAVRQQLSEKTILIAEQVVGNLF